MLTDMVNNGTQGIRGFIKVRASMRIKTIRPLCVGCNMIRWAKTLSTSPFIG
jgi:hypothetical protein